MMGVEEFKRWLAADRLDELADQVLLADGAAHVTATQFDIISGKIAIAYGILAADIRVVITGSAKLGFSLIEKTDEYGILLPRFRSFGPDSDIDVAVLSPKIFDAVWFELSSYAANQPWFPLQHKKLGPYLVSGWLRPDHFPYGASLLNCRKWFPLFSSLSADVRFGRRKVRAGLFNSFEQPRQYQLRSLRDAQAGANP
jgi:hypothetical protein